MPRRSVPGVHRWFVPLTLSYLLEGAGYIIAGTFLVSAVAKQGPQWMATGSWVLVGMAAVPSCVLWNFASKRFSRPSLLAVALGLQALGIVLPALVPGPAAAIAAAVLFGSTFMGVTTLTLAAGSHLRVSQAIGILSATYALGQVLGPIVAAPLLHSGYSAALIAGASLALTAGLIAGIVRFRFPRGGHPDPATSAGVISPLFARSKIPEVAE